MKWLPQVAIDVFMLSRVKYYYYYVFFNAYWASFDIGESTVPRQNAVFYMTLLEIFFLGGVSFILSGLGAAIDLNIVILIGVAFILILNSLTLSKGVFEDKYSEYEFLSGFDKRRRLWLFFSIIIVTGAINIIGAFFFAL